MDSDDKNLQDIESHNRQIGDEFNRLKSMVLKGTKA